MPSRPLALVALAALAPVACLAPLTPLAPAAPPAPSASGAPALAAPAASSSAPALASASASASASAGPPAPAASVDEPPPARLEIEPAYLAAAYPYPEKSERKALLQELERWNNGGRGDEKWHPVPRVVIEEPVPGGGKGHAGSLLRHLRAEHYWTVRRCYDPALRDNPELGGRVVMKISLSGAGVVTRASAQGGKGVPDKRKHKVALGSAAVGRCIAGGLQGARLPAPRKGGSYSFSIDMYPGDAPLPEPDASPSPGRLDLDAVDRLVKARGAAIGACFAELGRQKPGVWGRLALRLDVTPEGRVREARQVDSTFPEADAVACVRARLSALELPAPTPAGRDARVVVALRWKPEPG